MLRRDVEVKESKLSSSMNSIKTFWSPELKKERALRKDEVSKITVWKEQYRVIQDEAQVSVRLYLFNRLPPLGTESSICLCQMHFTQCVSFSASVLLSLFLLSLHRL